MGARENNCETSFFFPREQGHSVRNFVAQPIAKDYAGLQVKNGKQNIRYIGFQCTAGGGRRFEFSVGVPGTESPVMVDIGAPLFAGAERIMVQECAGICLSKIRKLFDIGELDTNRLKLCLTSSDVSYYRELQPTSGRRRARAIRPVT